MWGQFIEGDTDKTKTTFCGKEAHSGFQRIVRGVDKIIASMHHAHHWSFTVITQWNEKYKHTTQW